MRKGVNYYYQIIIKKKILLYILIFFKKSKSNKYNISIKKVAVKILQKSSFWIYVEKIKNNQKK